MNGKSIEEKNEILGVFNSHFLNKETKNISFSMQDGGRLFYKNNKEEYNNFAF